MVGREQARVPGRGGHVKTVTGDLWQLMTANYDAIGIPTNGQVKRLGDAVMGAGVAKAAAQRWNPWLQEHLGAALSRYGNKIHVFEDIVSDKPAPRWIFSFPTKDHWRDPSSMDLIAKSCLDLMLEIEKRHWSTVIMPAPGCGLGALKWRDVRAVVDSICDDRVHVAIAE